jgi:hypothetical protein
VRYSSLQSEVPEEKTIYPEEESERISITFPGASGSGLNLEGRIKYVNHGTETKWIQSQEPQVTTFEIILHLLTFSGLPPKGKVN